MMYVNFNGKILQEGTAIISADNRGIRYGDGLFETIKLKSGALVFEAAHFERLWKGLRILGFEIPAHFTKEKLSREIQTLCKKNGASLLGRVRLNVFRGDGGLFDAKTLAPNYTIQSWPLDSAYENLNSNGLVLGIYHEVAKSCDVLANLKHNNFLPYALAALHAKKEKWNDAIILNTMGRICDSSIANIFVVKGEVIQTPPLAEGCVAGVMRQQLLNYLHENNYEIIEQPIEIKDLPGVDEVFLTNSMANFRWVKQIGENAYTSSRTREIYNRFLSTIS